MTFWAKRLPQKPKEERILNKQACVNQPKVKEDRIEKRPPDVG